MPHHSDGRRGDPPPREPHGWIDPVEEARRARRWAITGAILHAVATAALAVMLAAQHRINRDTGEILFMQGEQIRALTFELDQARASIARLAVTRLERTEP